MGLFSKLGFGSKQTIAVTFLEEGTGRVIGKVDLPIGQLPDTFAIETQLDIAKQKYMVVKSEPPTKAEFSKTGKLVNTLRKVEAIDPSKMLFSLPTICNDALPESARAAGAEGILLLHEDDWRQVEFVAAGLAGPIEGELLAIRSIHADHYVEVGWNKIHVRSEIPNPLPPGIRWAEVAGLLGDFAALRGVAFGDPGSQVIGAVGARLADGVVVWGVERDGNLEVLCTENLSESSPATKAALRRVAQQISLCLVDWCHCQVHSPAHQIANAAGDPLADER
jgi:hypothetical protein